MYIDFHSSSQTQRTLSELSEVSTVVEQVRSIDEEEVEEEEEEEKEEERTGTLSRSQRMNQELDAASSMLEQLTQSLFVMEPVSPRGHTGFSDTEDNDSVSAVSLQEGTPRMKRRSRTISQSEMSRHSVVSASLSEPDLTQVGLTDTPAHENKYSKQASIPVPTSPSRRPGTPTDKLSLSLNMGHAHSVSPFLHGRAMMSPTHTQHFIVNGGSPVHSADDRFSASGKHKKNGKGPDRSGSAFGRFKKSSSMKKGEGSPVPARYGSVVPHLTKSSSAFFPHTMEHAVKPHKSVGGSLKGIWKRNSRKKSMKATMEADECVDSGVSVDSPPRDHPRRSLSLRRKNSFSNDLKVCVHDYEHAAHTVHVFFLTHFHTYNCTDTCMYMYVHVCTCM